MTTTQRLVYLGGCLATIHAVAVQATLIDNGDGTITDTSAGLMWLADLNYTNTTGYDDALYGQDTNGALTWNDAMYWAEHLSFAGYADWRLPSYHLNCETNPFYDPSSTDPNYSSECLWVESGDFYTLYYDSLGNVELDTSVNLGPFTNLPNWPQYWTSEEWQNNYAYDFHLLEWIGWNASTSSYDLVGGGYGHPVAKTGLTNATNVIAVRSINVPEPPLLPLIATGLLVIAAMRERHRQK